MRLTTAPVFAEYARWNFGDEAAHAADILYRTTLFVVFAALITMFAPPLHAQQGFDPRQTEKRFDDLQSGDGRSTKPALRVPSLARPDTAADNKPEFELRAIALSGASAMLYEDLAASWRPYLGKKVSQADLAAIAQAIGDLYRAAGFQLSRAIVPPQDVEDGRVRIQVIEGSIAEIALKGDGAEQFGVRPMLDTLLLEHPSRLATLERQLLLVNGRPGVRIADSSIEEIGDLSGRFRLTVELKTWHVYTSFGVDNLGSSSVGPWQLYALGAFNSYLLPGDTLAVNLSTIANDPRELGFGRIAYEAPVGVDGVRLGGSALYSEVRPGDVRRLFNDLTRTGAFEAHASVVAVQSLRSTLTLTAAFGFTNAS